VTWREHDVSGLFTFARLFYPHICVEYQPVFPSEYLSVSLINVKSF
jgi:hypothetical protein